MSSRSDPKLRHHGVRERLPNAVDIRLDYPREDAVVDQRLSSLEPLDQYLAYYRSVHGAEPQSELVAAFNEILDLERETA